ncbi:MAG: hypothetical protein ACWGPN_03300 [Gammaproteobacteria bacterium]
MSQMLERGLRRQRAIQQSRSTAWAMLAVMLPIAFFALISMLVLAIDGTILSLGGLASALIAVCALWVAAHLFGEARRLGRLLKDPKSIMRSDQSMDLISGVHWSSLNPFSGWRD